MLFVFTVFASLGFIISSVCKFVVSFCFPSWFKSELVVTFFLSPILKTRIISFLSTWDGTGRKYPASAGHPVGSSHQVTPLLDGADLTPTRSCPSISSGLDLFSSPNSLAFFRPIVSESSEVCKVTPP